MTYSKSDFLVSPQWLYEHKDESDLVIVDCPWEFYSYTRAHIPGAKCRLGHPYVKSKDENGNPILHLPSPEEIIKLTKELEISPETTVVLYDEWGTIFAARLWWVLKYYGHDRVKILNGGWQGWVSAGLPISVQTPKSFKVDSVFVPAPRPERLATLEQIKKNYSSPDWQIIDARSDEEYFGKNSHGNKRLGHIPGATHLEWNLLLENSDDAEAVRSFRSAEEIQLAFDKAGISKGKTTVTHCQAAVRGAFMAFAIELMGYPVPLVYDGSMAEWANIDDTPLE